MKTRNILTAAALMAFVSANAIELPELPSKEGFDIKGYVHDGTKGVAGVAVTDGYSITTTDADGAYYLTSSPLAYFVYYTLPSGYEAGTVENGVTKFFADIDRQAGETRADFIINPIGDDENFSFIVHADTQPDEYFNSNVFTELGKAYVDMQTTANTIEAKEGFKPFNLHLGDIMYHTDTQTDDYQRYLSTLKNRNYTCPIYATPGNHDRSYTANYNAAMKLYRETWGPTYHSFNRGNIHFVALDNVKPTDGNYSRGFTTESVEWLKKDLAGIEKGSRVVFMTHRPMTRVAADVKAYTTVLDILKDYDVLMLTGHLHRPGNNFDVYDSNLKERNQTALGGYEWRSACAADGTPNGYYIYEVKGNDISWKFKWTGRDADTNLFRMYTPGQFTDNIPGAADEKTVLINIWDWDEDWKVTWKQDGVDMGDVERYESHLDPWASSLYDNNASRPTWKSVESYHIFHCDVPATCANVEVTVTDPFGRTVSKALDLDHIAGIETVTTATCGVETTEVYNLQGVKLITVNGYPQVDTLPVGRGCYIMVLRHTDGTVTSEKVIL